MRARGRGGRSSPWLLVAGTVAGARRSRRRRRSPTSSTSRRRSRSSTRCSTLAQVKASDVVYDLGSGDGRIVITAAKKYGARGVGIEIDPALVKKATENAAAAGVSSRVRFVTQNLFTADLSEATVVTLYLLQSINERLRPKLVRELKPGTRIVSHVFNMGPEWPPEKKLTVDRSPSSCGRFRRNSKPRVFHESHVERNPVRAFTERRVCRPADRARLEHRWKSRRPACGSSTAAEALQGKPAIKELTAKEEEERAAAVEETMDRACRMCHPIENVTRLRRTVREWADVLTTMQGRGASATEEEFEAIHWYLNRYFGVVR